MDVTNRRPKDPSMIAEKFVSTQSENVRFVQSRNVLLGQQAGEDIEDGVAHEPERKRSDEGDGAGPEGPDESGQGCRGAEIERASSAPA